MQISSPTQAVNSADNVQESSPKGFFGDSSANWSANAKKGKTGIFARLLDGLISKKKIGSLQPNSGEEANSHLQNAGKKEKTSLRSQITKNTRKSFNFVDNLEGKAEIVPDTVFSMQGKLPAEHGGKVKNSNVNLNLAPKKDELPAFSEKPEFILAGRAEDGRNNGRTNGNKNETVPWLPGRERPKNQGNAEILNVSFRDAEAKFNQVQAALKQTRNTQGDRENSRLSESRLRKNRANIEIRDFRTGPDSVQNLSDAQKVQFVNASRSAGTEIEIPVNLNLSSAKENASLKSGKDGGVNKAFEEALARELRSGLSNDIVRDAAIILRNGGEGTIKLSLRPASLGDVKVRLEMTENKITGYIIVESTEALRAFERELPVLEKAFKDSGFSETNLEMSLAQDEWNYAGENGGYEQEENFPSLSPVVAASRYEGEAEWIGDPPVAGELVFSSSAGRTPVNLLV